MRHDGDVSYLADLALQSAALPAGLPAHLLDVVQVDLGALADVLETRRRRRRSGGIGFFGLLCCVLPLLLAGLAVWYAMRRRSGTTPQQPGPYGGQGHGAPPAPHGGPPQQGHQAPPPPQQGQGDAGRHEPPPPPAS